MIGRLRDRGVALAEGVARSAQPSSAVLPRVSVHVDGPVPAWGLRLVAGLVAAGCVLLVTTTPRHLAVAAVVIGLMVHRPASPAAAMLVAGVGLGLLASPADPSDWRLPLLIAGAHLVILLAALVDDLPWRAPVELGVIRGAAGPFLAIQAVAQTAALGGAWAAGRQISAVWPAVVAGIAVAGLTWALHDDIRTR